MELLKELDTCCAPKWVLRALGSEEAHSKLKQLYELIHAGGHTDEAMVTAIYGKGKSARYPPFRTLKTRLKEVYLNAISLREPKTPSYKTYDEAYQNGFRLLGLTRLLLMEHQFSIARKIAESTFRKVQSFEIIPLNQGLTDLLASLYLGLHYNEKKYNHFEGLSQFYSRAIYDLSFVSRCYREVRKCMYAEKISTIEIGKKAAGFVEQCKEIQERYPQIPKIQSMLISIEMSGCIYRGEYRKAIDVSLHGSQVLEKLKGVSKFNKSLLSITRVNCSIKLKDFTLGIEQIKQSKEECISDPINEFALKKMAILLGLTTRHYAYSYHYMANISFTALRRVLPPTDAQSWLVLEAYINFLVQAEELIVQESWPKLRRFRLGSFLNSVGDITQNKSGTNVQILVVRFLFSLLHKKYDTLIDQAESLKTYSGRYLKGPENIRNRSFFKLMDLVVRGNFNRLIALKKSKVPLQKLASGDGQPGLNDIEIIPYEALWHIILEQLEVRKRDEQELQQLLRTSINRSTRTQKCHDR